MKNTFFVLLFILPLFSIGQIPDECFVDKYFLIINSTKNYQHALLTAQEAAEVLDLKLNLRGLVPVAKSRIGLSPPVDTCLKYAREYGGQDSTCYIARGRWDDGMYVSIEYSNAYTSFKKGYYIVMVGSSFNKDAELIRTLKKAKTAFPDAYIKASKVYMCCMN